MSPRRVLVLGGARSGKSAFAERQAAESGAPVLYVATATALDEEMAARIRAHQARRPSDWRTLDAPTVLPNDAGGARTVVVEDLTLLLFNLMQQDAPAGAEREAMAQVERVCSVSASVIIVSNEVGMGIVPAVPLGRLFRDALGRVNQRAAERMDEVYVLFAGLPLRLK
ncbi:MAG: bifunctional adenosylcobinamide kinase/adenosylcobinamide-phosphate guanylyltransferase [Chloroflexota bacterium]|nr:bifunctional adenosylcobinamide kinase/adenosylcobinamide-phosphate guanylyltransferase [Chloroflexota bacterium]